MLLLAINFAISLGLKSHAMKGFECDMDGIGAIGAVLVGVFLTATG
ncbi:MAG: hypothetical protein LUC34_03510 [Campylobacter sp.]|nr:hypothetical protein [Campylobacter sp.]